MIRKSADAIRLLESDPSEQNIARVKVWLSKKKKATKAVNLVATKLMAASPHPDTLSWLGDWLAERDWEIAFSACRELNQFAVHDWLIDFASKNSQNPQVGRLWYELLLRYCDDALIEAASKAYISEKLDRYESLVGSFLLEFTQDLKVVEKAQIDAKQDPTGVGLIASLIANVGDEESIEMGVKLLEIEDPANTFLIAEALLKQNILRFSSVVESWLRSIWSDGKAVVLFEQIVQAAPSTISSLLFEWLDDYPAFANFHRILRSAFIFHPSQKLLDQAWDWVAKRIPEEEQWQFLAVLSNSFAGLKVPADALKVAERWIEDNLERSEALGLLGSILGIEPTEYRINLARRWFQTNPTKNQGPLLLTLLRTTELEEFETMAKLWREGAAETDPLFYAILVELLNKSPDIKLIEEAKAVFELGTPKFIGIFRAVLLPRLVELGDAESIRRAKSQLKNPVLRRRWADSIYMQRGRLLLTLLNATSNEPELFELASKWLENESRYCNPGVVQKIQAVVSN